MKLDKNNIRVYLLIFFALNLIQAFFTPITDDEAYYWMYSKSLDWGYFDHPPVVAVIIKLGSSLFDGVMGVRLITTLLTTLSLAVLWQLLPQNNRNKQHSAMLFFLLALSIPIFNMYGFISTPDVPLLFFSSLYILVFRKFVTHQNFINALLTGVIAALLMYSKYHGSLVILFTLLANSKVLKKGYIYFAGAVGIALFYPHINWQIEHEFATFKYHLIQRSDNTLQVKNILEYLLNVFLVLNPALIFIFVRKWIKKDLSASEKTYKWLFVGVLCVFSITSLKGHVEPHWVAINSIPLLILLHSLAMENDRLFSLLKKITLVSVALILILRIVIALPLFKIQGIGHNDKEYYSTIQEDAGTTKVAYVNSYQKAALHTFYTGKPAFSFNTSDYRKNQYDIWNYEDEYNNEEVYLVGNWPSGYFDTLYTPSGELIWKNKVMKFPMVNKMEVKTMETPDISLKDSAYSIQLQIINPYEYDLVFNDETMPIRLLAGFINENEIKKIPLSFVNLEKIAANSTVTKEAKLPVAGLSKGKYNLIITAKIGYLYDVVVSRSVAVTVE